MHCAVLYYVVLLNSFKFNNLVTIKWSDAFLEAILRTATGSEVPRARGDTYGVDEEMHRMKTLELLASQMTDESIEKTFWTTEHTHIKHSAVFISSWHWQLQQPLPQIAHPSTQISAGVGSDLEWQSVRGNRVQRIDSRWRCCSVAV